MARFGLIGLLLNALLLAPLPCGADEPVGDAFTDARNPIRILFNGERLDLWSLRKPTPRAIPPVASQAAARNPIDAFIQEKLTAAGIAPAAEADRRTLIRRLSFDLNGLPPEPEAVEQFLADESPHAFERLVNRLLDSPRYGERWARHWLDVVRYADTHGYERDEFRPLAWQYRDYVIRSFNQDKPFDRFIREQLAGDELVASPPTTAAAADALIATGFLRLGQWDSTASIFQEEARLKNEQQADLVNTTGAAFLGLTFGCCQCHDHKYDPLSQADHYRLRAFFAALQPRDDLNVELADDLACLQAHNQALDQRIESLKARKASIDKNDKAAQEALDAELKQVSAQKQPVRHAMGATDTGATAPPTFILDQGDFHSPREEVAPGFVSLLAPGPITTRPPRDNTTGRRLALAHWIASPDNPWTARVLVNRVWQHHFGVGLVATSDDFGYSGARPTHPELLDWLSLEFMRRGWSIKELHRLIVTSATYRQSSHRRPSAATADLDPENRLLARQNVRRLDAETLRDSLLAVSGLLRPVTGGKPRWPHVPLELLHAQPGILEAKDGGDGGRMQGWYEDPLDQTDVRSVFLVRKRSLPIPFLQVFDLPDSSTSCSRRGVTVVAPQALMLLNSPEALRFAAALAEMAQREAGDSAERRIDWLFHRTLGRSPDDKELGMAREFWSRHREIHRPSGDRAEFLALRDLSRALLNLNEFIYVD